MKAFFHPDQHLHDPQQFMRVGVIREPKDLPLRTERLLGALNGLGITPAIPADSGLEPVLSIHAGDYVAFLKSAFERWRALPDAGPEVLPNVSPYWSGQPDQDGRPACRTTSVVGQAGYYLGDLAVPIGPQTWISSFASARTAIAAADALLGGEKMAYALCRPSGHHVRTDRAAGFCYLNNAAIAAERLLSRFGKAVVLDVDTHHGDGTQEIFYRRGDVLTVSLHSDPIGCYPFYTGYADETGVGKGGGANLNIPLAPGTDDAAYLKALEQAMEAIGRFQPEVLVVALGFDAHRDDPLATLALSTEAFAAIGARVRQTGCPIAIVQEGGYAIDVIADCLTRFLAGANE